MRDTNDELRTTGDAADAFPPFSSWFTVLGVSMLLVVVPLAWWPRDVYGLIKWVIVFIVATAAAAVWISSSLLSGEFSIRRNGINLPLALLLLWSSLSLWTGTHRWHTERRLAELAAFALLYAVIANTAGTRRGRAFLVASALTGVSAISLLGVAHYVGLFRLDSPWGTGLGRRVYGTMLNPNFLADYLTSIFPLALSLFALSGTRGAGVLPAGAMAASFLCLLFTVSWGGWSGWFVSAMVCLRIGLPRCPSPSARARLAIPVAVLAALLVLFMYLNRSTVAADSSGMRSRFLYWRASLAMIRERPIIGFGLNAFQPNIPKRLTAVIASDFPDGVPAGTVTVYEGNFAHNEPLGIWLETGIVGLAIFVWLVVRFYAQAMRNLRSAGHGEEVAIGIGAIGGMTAALVQSLVSYPFRLPATTVSLALLMGLVGSGAATRTTRVGFGAVPAAARWILAAAVVAGWIALVPRVTRPIGGEDLYVRARHASAYGDWRFARDRCREALRHSITEPELFDLLGESEERLGNYRGAVDAFQRKLALKPYDVYANVKLGRVYDVLGMEERAAERFAAALALERHDSADGRVRLAEVLLRRGRTGEALGLLREGLRRHRSDWMLRNALGIACASGGDRAAAATDQSRHV